MKIKPEPHTDDKKAYLTYPPQPAAKARLLKEYVQLNYDIFLDGIFLHRLHELRKLTRKALEECGFEIKEIRRTFYSGNDVFITAGGKKIPVVVRKIQEKGELKQIRVRITAKTHEELMERTYAIRDTLAAYGLKHKLCIWDRTGDI